LSSSLSFKLRRAISKPLLRGSKKAEIPPPCPLLADNVVCVQLDAPPLFDADPFASDRPLCYMQQSESGIVLPREDLEPSRWSVSSESIGERRRVWSKRSFRHLFKLSR
jgi:hypothetical protein